MFYIVFSIHIALCLALVGLVLLQQGKGADAGALMGGGTDGLLGAGAAGSAVSKLTTWIAIGFMVTSLVLVKQYQVGAKQVGLGAQSARSANVLEGSVMAPLAESEKADAEKAQAELAEAEKLRAAEAAKPVTRSDSASSDTTATKGKSTEGKSIADSIGSEVNSQKGQEVEGAASTLENTTKAVASPTAPNSEALTDSQKVVAPKVETETNKQQAEKK